MDQTSSTIAISQECLADIENLNDDSGCEVDDGMLYFDNLECDESYDPFSNQLLAVLHKHRVNGCIKFYSPPTNIGRHDSEEFGYEFEDGIRYELETVVTWQRKETASQ